MLLRSSLPAKGLQGLGSWAMLRIGQRLRAAGVVLTLWLRSGHRPKCVTRGLELRAACVVLRTEKWLSKGLRLWAGVKQGFAVNSGGFPKQNKECVVLENLTPLLGAGCSSAVLLLGLKGREWWWLVLQRGREEYLLPFFRFLNTKDCSSLALSSE